MNRRTIALIVAALLVGGIVGGLVIALTADDDDDAVAGPDTTTTTTEAVTATGEDLLDLLAEGRDATFHATYAQEGEDGSTLTVEIWRDGELVRQDIVLEGEGLTNELASFQLPDGNVSCQRANDAEWTCAESVSTATEAGDPAGLLEAAAADLGGKTVTVTEETIGDVEARCFTIEDDANPSSELCVGEDGIPVRLSSEQAVLERTAMEDEVDPAVFEPPAEVSQIDEGE